MIRLKKFTRPIALALAALMTASAAVPASAVGNGVVPTYDEAYYAMLDYYGNLTEGSVVKSYTLNGSDSITDYGVYDEVVNLTDRTVPARDQGTTTFRFDKAPEHFYFEGKTAAPFQDLPWTVALHYTLNGVPAKAEDLAGKTGVVEILLDIIPNENASDYARYNYTLEAMAIFNQDDILSLEAPGAQVQLVGNLRMVLFLCLPGEEQHFAIRVGSNAFSFGGMNILMVPATLAQLEEINKLSQRKDDLEEDYRALSGSLDRLLDALSDIQSGLYASANGLDQLDIARNTVSSGKGLLYDDAGVLRGDLSNLAGLLDPVQQRAQVLSQAITDSKAVLNGMTDTVLALQAQLVDLENALQELEKGTGDVKQLLHCAGKLKDSLNDLEDALDRRISVGGSSSSSMAATVDQVKKVHGVYESAGSDDAFIAGMLVLKGASQGEAAGKVAGVKALQSIPALEQFQAAQAAGLTGDATEADWKSAQELKQLQMGVQAGMSFQSFCEKLPGVSKEQAKQMNDLWLIIQSGSETDRPSGTEEPAASQTGDAALPTAGAISAAMASSLFSAAVSEVLSASLADGTDAAAAGDSETPPANAPTEDDSGETPPGAEEAPSAPSGSTPSGGENNSAGGAAVDLIAGSLDSAASKLNQIQRDLDRTLDKLYDPTIQLLRDLADLCKELDDLTGLADNAKDLSAALRESSQLIRSILGDTDRLRNVLNGYEPTLQESLTNLGAMSTSAATIIRNMEQLLSDTESLMKTTGTQLDAGTKQTLKGLASALRQTAKAMAATDDVRDAKNTITDRIEDTWHEYTGDVNNILLMDAEAEAQSLTDCRNPAPSSVQVLIRTQEIKAEDEKETGETTTVKESTTFWGRIARMFQDFWTAITKLFR